MPKAKRTFLGTVKGFFTDEDGNVNWDGIQEIYGWITEDDGVDREDEDDDDDLKRAREFESMDGEWVGKAFEAYQKQTGAEALPTMVVGLAHQGAGNVQGAISELAEGKDPEANVGMIVGTVAGAAIGFALGSFIIPGIGNVFLSGLLSGVGGWLGAAIVGGFVGGYVGKVTGQAVKKARKSAKKLIMGDTEHLQKKYGLKQKDLERMHKYVNMRHSMVEAPYRQEVLENLHELIFNSKKGSNIGINKLGLYFASELVQLDLDPTMDDKSRETYEKELTHYLNVLKNSKAISETVKDEIRMVLTQHNKLKEGGQTKEAYEGFFESFSSDYRSLIGAMKAHPNYQANVGRPRSQSAPPRPVTTAASMPDVPVRPASAPLPTVNEDLPARHAGATEIRQAGTALTGEQFTAYEQKVASGAHKQADTDESGRRKISYSYENKGSRYTVNYREDYDRGVGHTKFSVDTANLSDDVAKDRYAAMLAAHANAHREQTGKSEVEILAAGDKDFAIMLYKHTKALGLSPKIPEREFSEAVRKEIAAEGAKQAVLMAMAGKTPPNLRRN